MLFKCLKILFRIVKYIYKIKKLKNNNRTVNVVVTVELKINQ